MNIYAIIKRKTFYVNLEDIEEHMEKTPKRKIIHWGLIFAFIIVMFCMIGLGRSLQDTVVVVFQHEFTATTLLGCLNVLQIAFCALLTCNDWNVGGKVAYGLLSFYTLTLIGRIITGDSIDFLPGICMAGCGYIFISMLRIQLKEIDHKNQTYQLNSVRDMLTELSNRRGMQEYLDEMIYRMEPFYLLFLDLDNFKYVNDTLGHTVGDMILKTVASRCQAVNNPGGLVARNGGDEYIIVVPSKPGMNIKKFAQMYIDAINQDIWLPDSNMHYQITGCIGISHYPKNATTVDEIINYADTAMYEAKDKGENRIEVFDRSMAERAIRQKSVEDMVRKAIQDRRLIAVYQPQFNVHTKEVIGFEALIRMKNEEGELVPPASFIPIAEKSDLIFEVDNYVLQYVMEDFKEVAKVARDRFFVSVNVSAKHIVNRDFALMIDKLLVENGFPASQLKIEVTEYCMIQNIEDAQYTMNELNKLGVKIALDDFGVGYTSFSNLIKLPISEIKIDKSIIDNLNHKEDEDIIAAIVSIGHMLQCEIVIEGVETNEQLVALEKSNCDIIQGYVWGKPISYEEAVELYWKE